MLRGGAGRLPAGPLRRLVNHDPRVREREPLPVARRLQHDRSHRVGHALHDDRDLDAAADDVADGVVDGEAVGDVAAGAVDEQRDRPVVVVRELAQPLDARARGVFFDVADQVDVAQPIALLLAQLRADGVNELGDQAIAQLSHRPHYRILPRRAQPACGHEIKREREDEIDRHQLQPFDPVALAVDDDDRRGQHRQRDRRDLERVEQQRHRPADRERVEHERRRDEQRDLRAAADRDFHRQRHLVAPRGGDRRVVLGGVADDRDHDHADEQLREAETRQRRLAARRPASRPGSSSGSCRPPAAPTAAAVDSAGPSCSPGASGETDRAAR